MRLTLRPGLQVLRRDVHHLQLGLDWPGLATITDSPALQAVLAAIDGLHDADAIVAKAAAARADADVAACRLALDALLECGAVVEEAKTRRDAMSESAWGALWLLAGPHGDARSVVRRRSACAVHVAGEGQVAAEVRRLLPSVPLRVTESGRAAVVVLASDCEPEREASDAVMRSGQPHLWAAVRDLVGVVGPFVEPGRSACLRCVDAVRTDLDPAWPTLVDATTRHRGRVPACDPVLASLVAAWAVQEIVLWAGGQRLQTRDATIEVPQGLGRVHVERYEPHPSCGCGWPQWQDTMGA